MSWYPWVRGDPVETKDENLELRGYSSAVPSRPYGLKLQEKIVEDKQPTEDVDEDDY